MSHSTQESPPAGWTSCPFWAIATQKVITGRDSEGLLSVYLDRGVIPYSEGGGLVHKPAESLEKYQLVEAGDFVMNNQQAWRGSVGVSKHRGIVSPAYLVFSLNKSKLLPEYAAYMFRDKSYVEKYMLSSLSVGDIQRQVKWNHLRKIGIHLPSKDEQQTLVSHLDRETTRIDSLIEKKTRFIELLKEKRQAVIANAVTKGLDPSAQTQESGVEWIGRIPAHWSVRPLFSAAKEVYRTNKGMIESNLLSLSYGRVVRRDINAGEGLLPDSFETYQIIEDGEIVMRLTDLQNDQKSLRTALATERGIVTSAYVVIRPSDSLNSEYLAHLMRAYDIQKVFYSMGGGMRQSMKFSDLRRLPLLIPSLQEQKAICSSLHPKLARIDQLVSKTERSIELLREHRSALITAVVTGKIDVRMSK
jgi:type I restriction enzyme S subunit